jgi:hypothetical protein
MLALLQFLQNLIGKRTLLVMVVLAGVSIIALEFTNVARNFFETYNQKQIAEQAAALQLALQQEKTALAIKAAEDAKRAAFDAQNAEAIARESALRQAAERREKEALADKADADRRNAEAIAREATLRQDAERREKQAIADNAPQQQKGLAEKAEGEGENAKAIGHYAELKAKAEAEKAAADAIKAQRLACVYDPSVCTADQRKVITSDNIGGRMFEMNVSVADRAAGGSGDPIHNGIFAKPEPEAAAAPDETPKSVQPTNISNGWTIYKGFGFDGGEGRNDRAPSFEVCGNICAHEAQCKFFTFYPTGQCQLLASHGNLKSYAGAMSAAKPVQKPSPDERNESKPSDDLPPATAQSAKTPPAIDCNKAFYSVEFVICSSPQLLETEARLEDANNAARARAVNGTTGQHAWWTGSFGQSCGLPAKGRPSPAKIRASQSCVADAMNQRISALQAVAQK